MTRPSRDIKVIEIFFWLEEIKSWLGPMAGPSSESLLGASLSGNGESRYGKYGPLMRTPRQDYYYSHSSGPYEFFNKATVSSTLQTSWPRFSKDSRG